MRFNPTPELTKSVTTKGLGQQRYITNEEECVSVAQWTVDVSAMVARGNPAYCRWGQPGLLEDRVFGFREHSKKWRVDHRVESSDLHRSILALTPNQTTGSLSRVERRFQVANRGTLSYVVWRLAIGIRRK